MTDQDTMTQCELRDGHRQHMAWIPRRFARRGAVLVIDSLPGRWTVTATYASRTVQDASERRRDHARQRDFSDA